MSTPAPLRVLWLTPTAALDGPGRALLALLNHWNERDTVAVCALRSATDDFRRDCPARMEVHALGMRGLWDVARWGALRRLCRTWRPDVIHTQVSRADWVGVPVARALGVPVITIIHNVHSRMYRAEFPPPVARAGALLDRLTHPLASRLIAVSEGVRRDLEHHGVPADRVVVIHNALDVERRRLLSPRDAVRRAWGYTPEDVVVGTAALLKTQKGIPYLIEAARRVAADHPHVHFVHMGSGPLKERIAALIAAAGLQSRFRMLDYVPEPMTLLSGLDMFVLPSLWEGLPIALLESMAAGLPAVGTRVAGIEDVIEHERTGLLVPPADAAALAAAISALATDPQLRARLGRAAGDSLSRFDARTIAAQYRALDAEVVARTRRHSHATS